MVSIKDVNHDSKEDIILATAYYFDSLNDYKVFVFLQNENGWLDDPVQYPYPAIYPGLKSMTVGDVNNDQLNDVIIGYDKYMGIFFQNDTGTLKSMIPFTLDPTVHSITTGDLNHDGLTDIIVSVEHWSQPYIRIYYQTATSFNIKNYPKPSTQDDEVETGDMNHDGLDDIILMNGRSDGNLYVSLQDTNGSFEAFHSYYPGPLEHRSLHGLDVGDLNNDDALDIAVSKGGNRPISKLLIWFQEEDMDTLPPPVDFSAYDVPSPVEIADLNCDGKNEIISCHSGWDAVTVFEQDSAGLFNSYLVFEAPTNGIDAQGLSIGDINDDGRPDIAVADFNEGVSILLNNSIPTIFDNIDTIIVDQFIQQDTVFSSDYWIHYSVDTVMNYQIIQFDSFLVDNVFHVDRFLVDSIFSRHATFCTRSYVDTLITSAYQNDSLLVSSDTFFISSHVDSVLVSLSSPIQSFLSSIRIFPNPADTYIILQSGLTPYFIPGSIQIFDNTGTQMVHTVFTEPNMKMDIRSLPDGLYYVLVVAGNKYAIRKGIKNQSVR